MSGLEAHLRVRLKDANPKWTTEFDALIGDEDVRDALGALRRLGGDPHFALVVVTHYRWRRIERLPALRERERLLSAVDLLLEAQGIWSDRLRGFWADDWKAVEDALRTGATHLRSYHPLVQSVFEARGTRRDPETPRMRSDYSTKCLLVLDWHVRQVSGQRRSNHRLLGRLIESLGMLKRSGAGVSADRERWVEKRLERAAKEDQDHHSRREYVERFEIGPLVSLYHTVHRSCGLDCGSACKSYGRAFRAEDQQELLCAVGDAQLTAQRGDHALARQLFQQALEDAEKLLGLHHAGLVPILEGSAAALRVLGQIGDAVVAEARIGRILEGCGHTREELIGFQPGAGPNGELLSVWRGPDDTSCS
jgi:hypothetical protein